jgi:hypothetical protein
MQAVIAIVQNAVFQTANLKGAITKMLQRLF